MHPPPSDGHSDVRRVSRLVLVLSMMASVLFGGGAATCAYLSFRRPERKTPPAHETVVRDTSSVVTAIRDLATLETSSYHIERVIDVRDRQSRLFGLVQGEDVILLVAAGDVVAGVDLTTMRDGDITFDPVKSAAYVTLPPASVLSARLDNERTYVHTRQTDALAQRVETLETRARQEAERSLREAALSSGILERAQQNAQRTIETLVKSLGFKLVTVRFRDAERGP